MNVFERLQRLYSEGLIGEKEISNAVSKNLISEEEKYIILNKSDKSAIHIE